MLPQPPSKNQDEPAAENESSNREAEERMDVEDTDYQIPVEIPSVKDVSKDEQEIAAIPNPPSREIESITHGSDSGIDGAATPIGTNEIIKLEDEVAKTIENANSVVDVPIPPYQQEDKILEEFVQMISNAPEEVVTSNSEITSTAQTTITTTTEAYHNHHHVLPEIDEHEEENEQQPDVIQLSTSSGAAGAAEEETVKESTITLTSTMTNAPEAETIFTPVNNIHNEHINVVPIDETLHIVTTSTTMSTVAISIEKSPMVSSKPNDAWTLLLQ